MAVVLAGVLQPVKLPESVSDRGEADVSGEVADLLVRDVDAPLRDHAGIDEARLARETHEVLFVQGASQAFAVEHGVLLQFLRYPPIGVYVREVELAAGLKERKDLPEHVPFVFNEIDDAVIFGLIWIRSSYFMALVGQGLRLIMTCCVL